MSSWLAALGPCASPKSRAKEHNTKDGSLEAKISLASSKRQGSLTDVRSSRKVAGSRSFREKIQDTFEGSLRRTKKTGSLEAVASRGETFGNPDTNMNVSTSFRPKAYKGSNSGNLPGGEPSNTNDNFWTNFYNTLPKNRHKTGRPNDLSLQNLPVSEMDSEVAQKDDEVFLEQTNATFKGFNTSPRAKPKTKTTEGMNSAQNKTLESMNSAPNSRKSAGGYEIDNRPGSDSQVIVEANEMAAREFQNASNVDCALPRSLSLQDEYWTPSAKGASAKHGLITSSPDRLGVRRSPGASPVQGHVWIRTKDGSHLELRAVECHVRDAPSPSDSQKADSSRSSYDTFAHPLTSLEMTKLNSQHVLPMESALSAAQTSDSTFTDLYMSPEQYQANIFELIQSLNQAPQSPASPEIRRSQEVKQAKSLADAKELKLPRSSIQEHVSDEGSRLFHSEKFIVLGNSVTENGNFKGGDDENREQPILTVRAHVFQIDPETKKNWIPASKSAVAVSYYYDSARNTYRIISVEGSKAIINSTITPNMAFTKTSQKFGQWSDPRANTVYGLGFGSEADLAKFIDKFKEVKELIRQQAAQSQSPTTVNGTAEDSQPSSATPREMPTNRGFFHTRSSSLTSMREPQVEQQTEQKENMNLRERRNSFNTPGTNGNTSPESQLKYENDKLKLALAQSSSNAKKWEIELQTLKNNNVRLTTALQESTANVEEWKKQLAAYKDETGRLRKKISEMEQRKSNPEETVELKTEIAELKDRMESLQRDHKYKDQEVDHLQQRLAEMTTQETANGNLQNKLKVGSIFRSSSKSKLIKGLEEENTSLQQQVHDLKQLLQEYRKSQEKERDELAQLQDHLGSKITELYEFHEHILATLQKESSS